MHTEYDYTNCAVATLAHVTLHRNDMKQCGQSLTLFGNYENQGRLVAPCTDGAGVSRSPLVAAPEQINS